jgi:para-aminobenzoate synthetase component II
MILIIDNYDSFVHNIARYFVELGETIRVLRNDEVDDKDLHVKAIVISPGPCTPDEAGVSLDVIRSRSGQVPILGVCLGHQAIGQAFGGTVARARHPMHGDYSDITHNGSGVFDGLPQPLRVGRYHSLIVEDVDATDLRVTARSQDGAIMGLTHISHPTFGVQFHPESILTTHGHAMFKNFLKVAA